MMGGGGNASAGSSPNIFLPPGQGEVAGRLGSTIQPLLDLSANAGAGTPAGQNYPTAQSFVNQYLTGGPGTAFSDESLWRAFDPAYAAADYGAATLMPQGVANASALTQIGNRGIPAAGQALNQGFDPAYTNSVLELEGNPFYQPALDAARHGAQLGAEGADALQSSARTLAGQMPFFGGLSQSVSNLMSPVERQAEKIGGTVDPLIQAGFDPQSALFNRSRGQLMDQTNAVNAMSGLAGTPYGASVSANALGNFDTNWQNSQLAREAQAAGAAGQAAGQAGSLYGTSGALGGQAGSLLSQAGQAADRSGLLYGMAPGLATSSGAAPSSAYTGNIDKILQGLGARNQGAGAGLANYGAGASSAASTLGAGQAAGAQGAQLASQFGAAPYNLGTGVASNALAGLTNATNLGNNQFNLPNQEIGNMMQYLGLGQNASQVQGQLQNQSFNQLAQGLGGGLSAANTLFGGGGSGGGGLLGGLGSALGGGGSFAGPLAGTAALNAGLDPFAGAGALALGTEAGVDFGAPAAAALPFALSA